MRYLVILAALLLSGCIDPGYGINDPYALRAAGQQAVSQADSAIAATQAAQFERAQAATLEAERTQSALQVQAQQAAIVATATANEFAASSSRATATQDAMMAMSAAATAGAIQAETTQAAALRVSGLYATMTVQSAQAGAAAAAVVRDAEWNQATDIFLRCGVGGFILFLACALVAMMLQAWRWSEARREIAWAKADGERLRRLIVDTMSTGAIGYDANGNPVALQIQARQNYLDRPRQNMSYQQPSEAGYAEQAEPVDYAARNQHPPEVAEAIGFVLRVIEATGKNEQGIPRYDKLPGVNPEAWMRVTDWLQAQGAIVKVDKVGTMLSDKYATHGQLLAALVTGKLSPTPAETAPE